MRKIHTLTIDSSYFLRNSLRTKKLIVGLMTFNRIPFRFLTSAEKTCCARMVFESNAFFFLFFKHVLFETILQAKKNNKTNKINASLMLFGTI